MSKNNKGQQHGGSTAQDTSTPIPSVFGLRLGDLLSREQLQEFLGRKGVEANTDVVDLWVTGNRQAVIEGDNARYLLTFSRKMKSGTERFQVSHISARVPETQE